MGRRLLQDIYLRFVERVDCIEMMAFITCLTKQTLDTVQHYQTSHNSSKLLAAQTLFDALKCHPDGLQQAAYALRQCGHDDLANEIDPEQVISRKLFQAIYRRFVERVDSVEMLGYITCLTEHTRDTVRNCQTAHNGSKLLAAQTLFAALKCRPDGLQQAEYALRQCGHDDLANEIDPQPVILMMDDRDRKRFRAIQVRFVERVDAVEMLGYITCLTDHTRGTVRHSQTAHNGSKLLAAQTLFAALKCRPDGLQHAAYALRQCMHDDLANEIDPQQDPRIEALTSYYDTSKHMHFNVLLVMKHTATDEYWTLFTREFHDRFMCNEDVFETNCECFVVYEAVRTPEDSDYMNVSDAENEFHSLVSNDDVLSVSNVLGSNTNVQENVQDFQDAAQNNGRGGLNNKDTNAEYHGVTLMSLMVLTVLSVALMHRLF